ncbi:MAG TPA: DNA polymerase domain-containing protein, partial [Thermomicrobiales bacterium]|nr:DNA polymerase domain-containing protein [Thermomicrobiales bacterium]
DPLAGKFDPTLSQRTTFLAEDADALLYGVDPTDRVVAVEPSGSNEVLLYRRGPRGNTTTERRVSQPWLLTSDPERFRTRADASVSELRRGHGYRFLVTFDAWEGYRAATSQGRDDRSVFGPSGQVSQFLVRTGLTLFKGMDFPNLRRMQIDLETLSLDPNSEDAGIIMISVRQGDFENVLVLESTEAELIERFNALVRELDPDVIEGHNLYRFDFPYLIDRARHTGVTLRLGRDGSAPRIVEGNRRQPTAFVYGRHIVDTYMQIQRFDVQGNLTRYGLKEVIRQMGLERDDRVFVDRTTISDMWRSGERDRERLAAYALDDVRDVDVLSQVILPTEFYQTQMLPTTYQRSCITGTGRKIDELMLRTYLAAGYSVPRPERSRPYPGGYVELISAGVFGPVVKCDVESLYPSIMLAGNIAAASDVLEAFPLLLRDLTTRRIEAKRRARYAEGRERAVWQGLQGSFKILINSFYGYLGFGGGSFNDYDAAEQVTLEGQRLIQQVVSQLRANGAQPIEVDTDGVYFSPPTGVNSFDDEEAFIGRISDTLPEGINLAHDGRFRSMLSLKQKTYALLDYDGTLTLTGSSLRSRALEACFQRFIRDAARAFMEADQDEVKDLYFNLAGKIRNRELDVHDISQWTMLKPETISSRKRLKQLLDERPGQWTFGERVEVYEREDGSLAFAAEYDHDENTRALLKRLRDVADRFRPVFPDDAEFEAAFPLITPTTNLNLARQKEPTRQLGLF